jgi:hypothetical protein
MVFHIIALLNLWGVFFHFLILEALPLALVVQLYFINVKKSK